MSKTTLGVVIERIHRKVSPQFDGEATAYEQAYALVQPKVQKCRNVNATTPRLTQLQQQLDGAEQTRAQQVTAGNYKGALATVTLVDHAADALLTEAKSQVEQRLGFEKVHAVLKPQVDQAKLQPAPGKALQDLMKGITDAETDLAETVKDGVKDYGTANKVKLPALVTALKAFNEGVKKFAKDKLTYETASKDLIKSGGPVELAKAIDTPSQALKDLKQAVVDREKEVTDQLLPTVLNYEEATKKLPALAKAVKALTDAKNVFDEGKKAWEKLDGDFQEALNKLAEAKNLKSTDEPALTIRMNAIKQAVKDGDFKKAIADLPQLKLDIAAAQKTAKEKDDCHKEYDKVVKAYTDSKKVPGTTLAVRNAIKERTEAYNAFYTQYSAGNYTAATPLLAAVKTKSEAVLKASMTAAVQTRPEISTAQESRATTRIENWDPPEKKLAVKKLVDEAPTPSHKQNLLKAIASGHTAEELETFNNKIKDKDAQWLRDNLRITASSTGKGVQQQFHMSCQATMVQAVKAELDPIYALKLREENPHDISDLGSDPNSPLAREQKQLLETAPIQEINSGDLAKVNQRISTESQKTGQALQKLLDDAQSNWEKNELLEVMARPQNYTPAAIKSYYDSNVKDKGPKGGQAIHKAVLNVPSHRGRGAVDLLNRSKDVTGLKFETQKVDASNRAQAVDDMATQLTNGHPCPIIVGGGEDEQYHYVVAVSVNPGPPKTFYIHDPADGSTVARTEEQIKTNKLDLPSGWSHMSRYDKATPI